MNESATSPVHGKGIVAPEQARGAENGLDITDQGGRCAEGAARKRIGTTRLVSALVLLLLAGGAYLAGGFIRFAEDVSRLSAPLDESADGIVVLTGGELRVERAVDLLKHGRGERLLISGVNPHTSVAALSRLTKADPALFACCVDIDRAALNTIGNAEMTARWAVRHGFDRLILVTSDYHIPRSLVEFAGVKGAPEIVPYPVSPEKLWRPDGLPSGLGLRLLASEYAKMLVARFRITFGLDAAGSVDWQVAARSAAFR